MEKPQQISEIIARLIELAKDRGRLSVEQCMNILGEKSIPMTLLLFGIVDSIPALPGFSTLSGFPVLLLGGQLCISSKRVWLPEKVESYHLRPGKLLRKMERLLPRIRQWENKIKPRWRPLTHGLARNFLGLIFMLLGVLLILPIPFTNLPIGIVLTILALGLAARDGLVITIGFFGFLLLYVFTIAMADAAKILWDMLGF